MRFLLGLVLVVAVVVAYPWVALPAGLVVVVWAIIRYRRRRRPAAPLPRRRLTTDDHLAARRAWRDLHEIERAAGLPPTPRTRPDS